MTRRQNRRRFLSTTAALAFAGARAYALDASKAGPNAAIQLGLIGCGFRGQQLTGALPRIVAVCDVHEGRMEQTRKRIGAERVIAYHDYRKLLENKDVDAVVITSNDHWHFLHAMHALQAGKDVYVEKPLCTSIHEGRLLVEAARKSRRVVQFGTWQRSMEHYCKAAEIVRSGRLGQVCQVLAWDYDNFYPGFGAPPNADPPKGLDWELYLGPAPQSAYNPNRYNMPHWYFFSDYSAGWQSGWGVHHFDIIHWATGARSPIAASAMGGKLAFPGDNTEHPDTLDGILQYPSCPAAKNGFVLHYTYRCGCRREARSHGKYFLGTHGALLVTRGGYWLTPETHVDRGFPKDGDTIVNALAWLDGLEGPPDQTHRGGKPGDPARLQPALRDLLRKRRQSHPADRRRRRGGPLRHRARPPAGHRLESRSADPLGRRQGKRSPAIPRPTHC